MEKRKLIINNLQFTFKRYSTYKDPGVEWIGEIPERWGVKRLKLFGKIYSGLNGKKGEDFSKEKKNDFMPFIPFTNICNNQIISQNEYNFVKISPYENQNKVEKNDLLFLMSSETLDDIGKCSLYLGNNIELFLNSFCKGFRFNKQNILARYCNLLFSSISYRNYFSLVGRGFTRINIKQDYINNLVAIIPPLPEQTAIANFLDEKCEKIDRAVAQKEKMVELLKERKQIMIQNAVTKGLNPNAKMKDSGVEWIGEIPEGWEVKKCKYLFYEADERSLEGKEELLSVSHMTGVTPRSERDVNMFLAENYTGSKLCEKGDIVYNIMWAWMGALGVSNQFGIVSPSYGVYRQKKSDNFNPVYLEELLKSNKYIEHYNKVSTGLHSSRLRFYAHMFFNMEMGFPKREEQDKIVTHIQKESKKIDKATSLQQKQIEKLKEYKITLINSAVTGKIKVG